jgi:hypothetical protein
MGSMVTRVVADGVLAFGREVEEGGGDEVGGVEDLKVALGGVVALGAVDDGLGLLGIFFWGGVLEEIGEGGERGLILYTSESLKNLPWNPPSLRPAATSKL